MDLQTINQILTMVLSVVAIIGIPLGVYKFYTKDQEADGEKITDNKTSNLLLAQKVDNLAEKLLLLERNEIHTLTEGQRTISASMNAMAVEIGKLTTIIDERVPRKTVDKVV